ncbi:MAG: hypothetical protein IPH35_04225 [Rhodoferax sp.]|nr:hypothetical protein [Rhodoferax sp.]
MKGKIQGKSGCTPYVPSGSSYVFCIDNAADISLHPLENGRDTLATTNAHGHQHAAHVFRATANNPVG